MIFINFAPQLMGCFFILKENLINNNPGENHRKYTPFENLGCKMGARRKIKDLSANPKKGLIIDIKEKIDGGTSRI